jgi:Holliday junction resolvasome RuvABC endonuclease subunit
MNQIQPKHFRILAIAPSSRGFGFAVLEGQATLADWGAKPVQGDKNAQSLTKVERLIAYYQPDVLVLEDASGKNSRRSARIKTLGQQIMDLAKTRRTKVALFSRDQVRRLFFDGGQGTKHAVAEILAQRFQGELGACLPPKRRLWMSEDRRMDIFDAVALAFVFRLKTTKLMG